MQSPYLDKKFICSSASARFLSASSPAVSTSTTCDRQRETASSPEHLSSKKISSCRKCSSGSPCCSSRGSFWPNRVAVYFLNIPMNRFSFFGGDHKWNENLLCSCWQETNMNSLLWWTKLSNRANHCRYYIVFRLMLLWIEVKIIKKNEKWNWPHVSIAGVVQNRWHHWKQLGVVMKKLVLAIFTSLINIFSRLYASSSSLFVHLEEEKKWFQFVFFRKISYVSWFLIKFLCSRVACWFSHRFPY